MDKYRYSLVNILLALVWLFFAYTNLTIFFARPKFSVLLFVLAQTEFVVLLLLRRPASLMTKNVGDYVLGITGTFIALLFQPSLYGTANSLMTYMGYAGNILICLGVIFEIIAFMYLNTSAGIVPANRGIKCNGAYRIVRHPIYASYLLFYIGFILSNPSIFNWCILVLAVALQIWRIWREEEVLMKDSVYREYSRHVKWRLIPNVF